jgi:phage/plasmid-like protein (TIGR03299 family)
MAHMIENNEIAYVGAKPWHGLGFEVAAGTSGQEMLEIAGLNYNIDLNDVHVNGSVVPNYKAITRGDTGNVFSIQSDRYRIVQNQEIVDLFREYCEAGHATMETVGAIRGGAIVWALAKLNGATKATLKGGDAVGGYILFSTSHDGTLPTRGIPTQVRVVCNNTFRAAMRGEKKTRGTFGFTLKHSAKFTPERASEAKEVLGISIQQIAEFNEMSAQLSNVTIDRKGQIEFISQLLDGKCLLDQTIEATQQTYSPLPTNGASLLDSIIDAKPTVDFHSDDSKLNRVGRAILDAIIDSPGSDLESAKNTLWGAINGVSYYTDHVASRTQDSRLYNSWFGTNVELKQSAVEVARNMAGIS